MFSDDYAQVGTSLAPEFRSQATENTGASIIVLALCSREASPEAMRTEKKNYEPSWHRLVRDCAGVRGRGVWPQSVLDTPQFPRSLRSGSDASAVPAQSLPSCSELEAGFKPSPSRPFPSQNPVFICLATPRKLVLSDKGFPVFWKLACLSPLRRSLMPAIKELSAAT